MKKINYMPIIIMAVVLLTYACNGGDSSSKKVDPTAIEMIVGVFEGQHSATYIKSKMDAVMTAYNVEITEKNYEKCGSALLNLRKAVNGVTEMDIIEHMLESDTGKDGISFPNQAALSASSLEK